MDNVRGVIRIYSATAALCPHIEWALARLFGTRVQMKWTPQNLQPGMQQAEYEWNGAAGLSARLASALVRCKQIRFEVIEEAPSGMGERYAFTPSLGIFHGVIDAAGQTLIGEDKLRAAMAGGHQTMQELHDALGALVGDPWDDELAPFRAGGDEESIRWPERAV